MARLSVSLFLCLIVVCRSWAGIQDEIVDPYVEVRSKTGIGSGTVIRLDGQVLILTAGHVVSGLKVQKTTTYIDQDGKEQKKVESAWEPAELIKTDKNKSFSVKARVVWYTPVEPQGNDLALLRPDDEKDLKPANFYFDSLVPLVGEDCWYIGTPMGLHRSLEKSLINNPEFPVDDWDKVFYSTNGNGIFGNSGGGLFVFRGKEYVLIGVVTRGIISQSWKGPVLCQTLPTINKFLDEYRKSKEKNHE